MANEFNSVPLGQAGTGAAYILPESQAVNTALSLLQQNRQTEQRNQQLKQQYAQQIAKDYQDNIFKAKNGQLFNSELMGLSQKHIQQGIDYAKQGWDIYNPNPNNPQQMKAYQEFMGDRAQLYNMQDIRDKIEKQFNEDNNLLSKAPAGKYDANTIKAQHDFIANNTLQDVVRKGLQLPSIQEAFDPEKNIYSKAQPVTFEDSRVVGNQKIDSKKLLVLPTRKNAISTIRNTPGAEQWFQQGTGLTLDQAEMLPKSLDDITKYNNDLYRTAIMDGGNNPQLEPIRQKLVASGITDLNSDAYKQFIEQQSAKDYQGKQEADKIFDTYVDRSRPKAGEFLKNNPDYRMRDQEIQEELLRLKKQELAKKDNPKPVDPTYFQDLSERMRTGVPGSGEEFNNQVANNPAYLRGLKLDNSNPKAVVITVPAKYKDVDKKDANGDVIGKERKVDKPSYKVTLDSTDPNQWHSGFARVYKDLTGDGTAVPSKAMTLSGKGKVPGGLQNPEQPPQKQGLVQKIKQAFTPNSGYSNIVDAKDSKGNAVQIGVKNGKWYYVKTNKLVDEPL